MNEVTLSFPLYELLAAQPYGDAAVGPIVARELWRAWQGPLPRRANEPEPDWLAGNFAATHAAVLRVAKDALAMERPDGVGVLRVVVGLPRPAKVSSPQWVPEVRV